jgi:hypothetical protein
MILVSGFLPDQIVVITIKSRVCIIVDPDSAGTKYQQRTGLTSSAENYRQEILLMPVARGVGKF